jgi:hypothetical protein
MYLTRFRCCLLVSLAAAALLGFCPTSAMAQIGGGLGGGVGGGIGGGGGNVGVGGNFQNAGVVVDAHGVLRVKTFTDPTGRIGRERFKAAMTSLGEDLAKPSKLRKISLNRLEKAIAEQIEKGEDLTDDMKYLAGMLRLQYVFFYPETNDIVIAGPAEGFTQDLSGRTRGLTTGRSTLELQDLIVALRAYPPNGDKLNVIGCSIDPTQEGLNRMQQFLVSIAGRVGPGDAARIARGLKESLGLQDVTIQGVSPKTHFAQVLVEADYRMKLIGIGLEKAPVKIKSWIERANPRSVARNALQRWYFTPWYDCIRVAEDKNAMELLGWKVRLASEAEMVQEGGVRAQTATRDKASDAFCENFSEQYDKLADIEPVYAQLRNLIDMSVAAAFMQENDYYGQAEWDLGVLADESKVPVETYETPKQVESAVNVVWKGSTLTTPIGGGVNIQPTQALKSENLKADPENKVKETQSQITLKNLQPGQWWWD